MSFYIFFLNDYFQTQTWIQSPESRSTENSGGVEPHSLPTNSTFWKRPLRERTILTSTREKSWRKGQNSQKPESRSANKKAVSCEIPTKKEAVKLVRHFAAFTWNVFRFPTLIQKVIVFFGISPRFGSATAERDGGSKSERAASCLTAVCWQHPGHTQPYPTHHQPTPWCRRTLRLHIQPPYPAKVRNFISHVLFLTRSLFQLTFGTTTNNLIKNPRTNDVNFHSLSVLLQLLCWQRLQPTTPARRWTTRVSSQIHWPPQ